MQITDNTTDTNQRSYKIFVLNVPSTHTEDDLRSAINSCFSTHVHSEYQVNLDSTTVEMSVH